MPVCREFYDPSQAAMLGDRWVVIGPEDLASTSTMLPRRGPGWVGPMRPGA
jgi:hypothetical protein